MNDFRYFIPIAFLCHFQLMGNVKIDGKKKKKSFYVRDELNENLRI